MRKAIVNGKVLELYDSVDEMPIANFQKYNRFMLLDAGIGSDIDSVDKHIAKVAKLLSRDSKADAVQELQNLRQNLYMIISDISPRQMAFAALIKSIDGKQVFDLSDDNLKSILAGLSRMRYGKLAELLFAIKKKLDSELEVYFPAFFEDAKDKEKHDILKKRTKAVLESIITGESRAEAIAEEDRKLFSDYRPSNFTGPDSAEIQYNKQFEAACLLIQEETGADPANMSVFQYYFALELIKKRAEEREKMLKRNRLNRK